MTNPRRHHYVPQFYLKGFCPPTKKSKIYVYDKNKGICFHTNVKNVAVRKDYYKLPDNPDPNITPFMLEGALANIESRAASLMPKIIKDSPLTDDERFHWANFVAVMYCRGPNARRMVADLKGVMIDKIAETIVSSKEAFEATIRRHGKEGEPKVTFEEARDFIHGKNYKLSIREDATLLSFILLEKTAPIIYEMNWKILRVIDNSSLLTTDTPVIYENPQSSFHPIYGDGGLMNKNVQICFPLDRKHMFAATWQDHSNVPSVITSYGTAKLNNAFIAQAYEYVYADQKDESIMEVAKKTKGHHRRIQNDPDVEINIERNFD